MSWLDSIVNWAGNLTGSDILDGVGKAAGIAGAVANLAGGKEVRDAGQASGYQSLYNTGNPEFTDFVKNDALQMIMNAARQPRVARPMRRLTSADMQGDFAPKAAYALQQYGDTQAATQQAEAAAKESATKQQQANSSFNSMSPDVMEAMVRNNAANIPVGKQRDKYIMDLNRVKKMQGTTNRFSGEYVDYPEYLKQQLKMNNSGVGGFLFSQANPDFNKALQAQAPSLHGATYDPSSSFLDRILPMLAVAGITAGAGLAGAPASAIKAIKGATSLAQGVAR